MGLFTDMARAQKNINGYDKTFMPAGKLGKRWLSEVDNVRRGRMQAEQIAEAMRGVTQGQAQPQARVSHPVRRTAPVHSTRNADRLAGRPEQAAREAQWAADAAAKRAHDAALDAQWASAHAPGDIVNGHRLDWTGTEWVWTPLSR